MDFILSGAFAYTAKELGAIDATVQFLLLILPTSLFVPGLFLATCVVSLSIGTSVGRYFRQFGSRNYSLWCSITFGWMDCLSSPMNVIPYLYYPLLLGLVALIIILFNY